MSIAWITGCQGFVGSHLACELTSRGYQVFGIDRPGRPMPEDLPVEPLNIDLSDHEAVAASLSQTKPDFVVHLASRSSAAASFDAPRETMNTNIDTTVGLLEGMRQTVKHVTPRLLSIGSCEEYGPPQPDELPLAESTPLRPASPYAVSKAAQTLLCQHYRRTYGLDILATRSFTHTGPGQRDQFVFSSFARQIAELERNGGGVLRVGNLAAIRDMSDVRDVAKVYADLLETDWNVDVVNVCSGRDVSIEDGLQHLLRRAKVEVSVETDPKRLRPSDVPRFVGDPSRLVSMIGWSPQMPFEKTLDDLLQWWRQKIAATSKPTAN